MLLWISSDRIAGYKTVKPPALENYKFTFVKTPNLLTVANYNNN